MYLSPAGFAQSLILYRVAVADIIMLSGLAIRLLVVAQTVAAYQRQNNLVHLNLPLYVWVRMLRL